MARIPGKPFVVAAASLSFVLIVASDVPSSESRRVLDTPAIDLDLTIASAELRYAQDVPASLLVKGKNFGNAVAFLQLGDIDLTPHVTLWTGTMIEADLLSHHLVAATYIVKVHRGIAPNFRDQIDLTIGTVGPEGPRGPQGDRGEQGDPGPPGPTPFIGMSCPEGEVLVGFDAGGQLLCRPIMPSPPEGRTITLAANPATISLVASPTCAALLGVTHCGQATIIATVRNEFGVPQPGQDVRFSSTAGLLYLGTLVNPTPAANIPILTDSIGNATLNIITGVTSTVTATAGLASATLTLSAVQSTLGAILLTFDNTAHSLCTGVSTPDVTSCSQEICFVAEAVDTSGGPLDGLAIVFFLQNNSTMGNAFNGSFIPSQAVTGSQGTPGMARTRFIIHADCPQECSVATGGGPCIAEVVAATTGGFQSFPLQLTINIP